MPEGTPEPRTARQSWVLAGRLAVSAGLLAYVSSRVDFGELGAFLLAADPSLLGVALALYLGAGLIAALKWHRLAAAVGIDVPRSAVAAYYFTGTFFNTFGFGTVGGDVVRALYLGQRSGRRALAVNTVLADRVSGLLVLLAIALIALLLLRQYDLPAAIYWSVIVLSSGLLGGWLLLPRLLPLVLSSENRLRRLVEQDLAPYWNDGRLLVEVAALSACFHFTQVGVLIVLTHALGVAVPWSYCFILGPIVNILSSIPVSVNGLGVREGGYVFFLSHVGVDRDHAVGFALTYFAVVMLAGAVGGIVYLVHGARRDRQ